MKYYIYADKFFFSDREEGPGYLAVENGVFGEYVTEKPDAQIQDYAGYYVAPGLVDTHVHGFAGHDVMDNSSEGLQEMSRGLVSCGVTTFLPTTLTASAELLNEVCQTVANTPQPEDGAKIKGIFLEGPFFNPTYKGAQNPEYMIDPAVDVFETWQDNANGLVRKIALAPEKEGALAFIKHATEQGVHVALGHTDATYEQAKQAVEAGATIFVHVYNGMRGLHHREPGVVGAALSLGNVYNELICDGHHVHPASAKIVMTSGGKEHTVLITDCMAAGGCADGVYKLGEFDVDVKDGTARLAHNGSLAGSLLKLYESVKNVIAWGIASPFEAYRMASYNAAKSVGLENDCGDLKPGYAADFIVVDDRYDIHETYIDGKSVYKAE